MKIIRFKNTKFFPQGYKAITIGPFVLTKPNTKLNPIDLNHEDIHWAQEKELLVIPFMIWYVIEFFIRLILKRNWDKAYKSIAFEQEAYYYQNNEAYLRFRKHFAWFKFYKKK